MLAAVVGRLRPALLLPGRAGRGLLEPRPLRRCALRTALERRRFPRDGDEHTPRRLRRRAQAPDHDRHLRALVGLLRRVLRHGPEGAHDHPPRARGGVRAVRRARLADEPDRRVPARRQSGRPARDVPLRRPHDPVVHGGPARPEPSVRTVGRAAGRAAAGRPAVLGERPVPHRARARTGDRLRHRSREVPGVNTTAWEPVIGLEIHIQLSTRTKMFCRCPAGYGASENTHTCPVCLAFPGALPVPNREAIERTIRLGLALGCEIADRAVFHRKNYFYPDLPKAYQISQYDEPLCSDGSLVVPTAHGDVTIGIVRAHLEEDAAKNVHVAASGRIHGATATLVDFNRGGTPLVEIVTTPDIHDAETAKRFLHLLRQTVVELGLSDAELEK